MDMHQLRVERNLTNAAKKRDTVGKSPHATLGHKMCRCCFKCDYIENGLQCNYQCNIRRGRRHTECKCSSHFHIDTTVIILRQGLAKISNRRQCRGCSFVVGDNDDHDDFCCGCCQAWHEETADSNWKRHGRNCSSIHAVQWEPPPFPLKRSAPHSRQAILDDSERRAKAPRIFYDPRVTPIVASSNCWAGVHRWKPADKLPASDGWDDYGDVKRPPSDERWHKERPPLSLPDSVALLDTRKNQRSYLASILSSRLSCMQNEMIKVEMIKIIDASLAHQHAEIEGMHVSAAEVAAEVEEAALNAEFFAARDVVQG